MGGARRHGSAGVIISRTPFRISLAGGGSDIAEYYRTGHGAVVAMSISLYMYVTVNKRFDDSIRVSWTQLEIVDRLDDLRHDLIRECLRMVGIERGIEVTTIGDVPGGTGLGSSSSLTVGLLHALYAYRAVRVSATELARRACEVEIGVLGRPIGKQDQYMAALGGVRELTFHGDERVTTRAFRLDAVAIRRLRAGLMLFYTGIERDANAILAEVRRGLATDRQKRETLDSMVGVTHHLAERFARRDFSGIGDVLNLSWAAKRRMGGHVSNPRLDDLHHAAMTAGAAGAKILGAGGGGFLLVACEPDAQATVTEQLTARGLRRVAFGIESSGSRLIFPARLPRSLRQPSASRQGRRASR
jgi:D-glycero-alpha-D-manno-heptose-7-phosphate kinase